MSDGGAIASFAYDGKLLSYNKIRARPDLEGIIQIPSREEYLEN